jgi:hypothetical protein
VVLVAALILGVACGLVAVAVSASLRVVIGKPPGIRASAGGYSQQAELTGSATVKGGIGTSVALSGGGSTALAGAIGYNSYAGAGYVFTPGQRRLAGLARAARTARRVRRNRTRRSHGALPRL